MAGTNYNYELNKGMKVFSQLFVGIKEEGKEKNLLGFATPYEDNAQGRKRQETVKSWCGGYDYSSGHAKKIEAMTKIVENVPRDGFKITDDIKRVYWGGGNVVFRVADPYGYEQEIQSSNLMALIQVSGITAGGEIPGKCIWGRDGANNILLHEQSTEYKNAIMGAEKLEVIKTLGKDSTNIGNEYLLKNGSTGIYLGKYWITCMDAITDTKGYYITNPINVSYKGITRSIDSHIIAIEEAGQYDLVMIDDKAIQVYKKAPLVRELKKGECTPRKCESLSQKIELMNFAGNSDRGQIALVTKDKPKGMHFVLVPWSKAQFNKRMTDIKFRANNSFNRGFEKILYPDNLIATSWRGPLEVFFENMICYNGSFSKETFNSGYGYSGGNAWGILVNNGDCVTVIRPGNTNSREWNTKKASNNAIPAFEIPGFSDVDSLVAWCEKQYDDGKLMELKLLNGE
jgi:hypothetical protein